MKDRKKQYICIHIYPFYISLSLSNSRPHVFLFPNGKTHFVYFENECTKFKKYSLKYKVMKLYLKGKIVKTSFLETDFSWFEADENDIVFFNALKEIPQRDKVWIKCLTLHKKRIIELLKIRLFSKKVGRCEEKK